MLKKLFQVFRPPQTPATPDPDAELALGALLVRVAQSDRDYQLEEISLIDRILRTRYGLDVGGAILLREQAEALEAEAPDTVRFTRAIKDAVPYENRMGVVEALWQVVLADGERDAAEDALLRLSTNLLGVSDVDSARARQRAEKAL